MVTLASTVISLTTLNQIIQAVAGCVAIAVGIVTFVYYCLKIRKLNRRKTLHDLENESDT